MTTNSSDCTHFTFSQAPPRPSRYGAERDLQTMPSNPSWHAACTTSALSPTIVSDNCNGGGASLIRSEEHTSELQSLMRISYAVFCLQKKNKKKYQTTHHAITK